MFILKNAYIFFENTIYFKNLNIWQQKASVLTAPWNYSPTCCIVEEK